MNKILYLHGFNSSPQSYKARTFASHMAERNIGELIEIPEIYPVPDEAMKQLDALCETILQQYGLSLVGSSLGGFYATWLAEKYDCKAVLVNPAVNPHELLKSYLGENSNFYTDQTWQLEAQHIEQLKSLVIDPITIPDRYMVLLQTGDETLDYRLAENKYAACNIVVEEGGDHSFNGFDRYFENILEFCNVPGHQ